MRNLPVLLFESVSLFFLLDFSPQLAVDAVFSASTRILQAVLDDTSHVSEQAERGNGPTWRFIAKHELPEVYGDEPRQSAPKRGQEADAKWEELERAAESDDVG